MKHPNLILSVFLSLLTAANAANKPTVVHKPAPSCIPGAVMVTADADGEPSFECLGEAAPGKRTEPDTIFWIASNTKGIFSALVLNLVGEGKLSLEDKVEKYFPSWGKLAAKNRPTLRMLLNNTSGLPFFTNTPLPQPGVDAIAERAAEQPLQYEPDSKYLYSNWGFDVAAAIVEKVTGRPFDVEMKERIFDPLGMNDTTFSPSPEQNARRAAIYRLNPGKQPEPIVPYKRRLVHPYQNIGENPEAGSGLLSTPKDMIKFFQMIARGGRAPDGRIIIPEHLIRKLAEKQTPQGIDMKYSFGMYVNGKGTISHNGAAGTWGEANISTRTARVYMINIRGKRKEANAFFENWKRKSRCATDK